MQIKQPSRKKRNIILGSSAAIFMILLGACGYVYVGGSIFGWSPLSSSHKDTSLKPATKEQIDAGNERKKEVVNSLQENVKNNSQNSTGAQPNSTTGSLTVTITAANQNGQLLQIRALIGSLISGGKCTVAIKNSSGTTVTKTSGVQDLSNSSTCEGFDIPTSELSPGNWQIALTVSTDTQTGSATRNISIK